LPDRYTFGRGWRRVRQRRGITLETLAARTNVSLELWTGLETNDFSKWPRGLFARAFLRDYAKVIGLDPQELVDDFCRLYPVGDRRVMRTLQAQAELIGHEFEPAADAQPLPGGVDRRGNTADAPQAPPAPAAQRPARHRWWFKKASVP
jgi:transcriptional regulator with XRE-family HTH domain